MTRMPKISGSSNLFTRSLAKAAGLYRCNANQTAQPEMTNSSDIRHCVKKIMIQSNTSLVCGFLTCQSQVLKNIPVWKRIRMANAITRSQSRSKRRAFCSMGNLRVPCQNLPARIFLPGECHELQKMPPERRGFFAWFLQLSKMVWKEENSYDWPLSRRFRLPLLGASEEWRVSGMDPSCSDFEAPRPSPLEPSRTLKNCDRTLSTMSNNC